MYIGPREGGNIQFNSLLQIVIVTVFVIVGKMLLHYLLYLLTTFRTLVLSVDTGIVLCISIVPGLFGNA